MECEVGDPLVIALGTLGLATSFKKGGADFSHVLDDSFSDRQALWISGAVHKVLIEFNDEAAQVRWDGKSGESVRSVSVSLPTASGSSVRSIASARGGVEPFLADHPFLFLVVVEPKMTPLFIGRFCGK